MISNENKIKGAMLGVIVGDALGVPFEFNSKKDLEKEPVNDMIGFGTFNLPPGSWSDDSSMTLCLLEILVEEYNLKKIADNFVAWIMKFKWTPYAKVFGIGSTTAQAIQNIRRGIPLERCGLTEEGSNGNGSLMRILPLLWHLLDKDIYTRYKIIKEVSSITHAHIRSVLSCFYYLEFARALYKDLPVMKALEYANNNFLKIIQQENIPIEEAKHFGKFFIDCFDKVPKYDISSSGYVIHTLEASIWCLMTTACYKDAVLKAVNLGGDTDTTAAVTGGLAGLLYGLEDIPEKWLNQIARINELREIINKFYEKYLFLSQISED
jgi:ADP-ribosyl-[dinitrogen reductase] hydrolase